MDIKKLLDKWYVAVILIMIGTPIILIILFPNGDYQAMGRFTAYVVLFYLVIKFRKVLRP